MYLWKYFSAWFEDWTGRMSGLASLVLTVWAAFFPPTLYQARWGLIAAAIICFVLGSYHIWAKEHRAFLEARDKRELPDLKATLVNVAVGQWGITDPSTGAQVRKGSVITLFLLMQNRGNPSAVTNWGLWVDCPDGNSIRGTPLIFEGVEKWEWLNGTVHELRASDRLDTKLAEAPLPEGGQASGILIYLFEGLSREVIEKPGVKIRLEFSDVTDRSPYKAEYSYGTGTRMSGPEAIYLPGVTVKPHLTKKKRDATRRNKRRR